MNVRKCKENNPIKTTLLTLLTLLTPNLKKKIKKTLSVKKHYRKVNNVKKSVCIVWDGIWSSN
jgi:hypothetical protein